MHKFVIFLIVAAIGFLTFIPTEGQVQVKSEVLDRINVDTYLRNTRLVEYHMNCLVYNGPCDKIANEMKRLFMSFRYTGISATQCGVCNEEQKQKLHKISQHWQSHYPGAFRDLQAAMAKQA